MNHYIIIGNLVRDPETGTTDGGINWCRFTVAARKKRAKEGQPDAEFVRVTAWRGLGDTCAKYLRKGRKVCVIGGGAGCAIAMPVAEELHRLGTSVTSIVGFRNRDLVILEDEFRACSDKYILMTDDGSCGEKGVVTAPLKALIEGGEQYDMVIAIGPLLMMKFVVETTRPYQVPTTVSMNPIMIDGTGMCGGCRLTVGGETKFACVDGPDFDGHLVDFDEAMKRGAMYRDFEQHKRDEFCNLMNKEVK